MSKETLADLNSFVLVGDTDKHGNAWHYDGVSDNHFSGAVPLDRVRTLLDVPLAEAPVKWDYEGNTITDNTAKIIFRTDTLKRLGQFADSFVIHPYGETLIDNLASVVGESAGDLHIDSAGLLAGGAQAWMSISSDELSTTPEGVEYWSHIIASTSVDGTLSTTYKAVNTMVVCDNTREMALGEKTPQFKIKHSKYSLARLASAGDALGLINSVSEGFAAEVKALCETSVSDEQWSAFVAELTKPSTDGKRAATIAFNNAEELNTLYFGDERVLPWSGTAFGALQAANTQFHHMRGVKGDTIRADRAMSETIKGQLSKVERANADTLFKVLASV